MSVRIIGGERRGAILKTPEGEETRPLRDRIRQALFNIVRQELREAIVLDAFAGSGAVGLEALSNGASFCVFVESSPRAATIVRENIAKLRYEDRSLVLHGFSPEVVELSRHPTSLFSLLFLMPPYDSGLCEKVLSSQEIQARCAPGCLAINEIRESEALALPERWELVQERKYGTTKLALARLKK